MQTVLSNIGIISLVLFSELVLGHYPGYNLASSSTTSMPLYLRKMISMVQHGF